MTIGKRVDALVKYCKQRWIALCFLAIAVYWTWVITVVSARFMNYTLDLYIQVTRFFTWVEGHHGMLL